MLIYPKYIGISPIYQIGNPIEQNQMPLIIDKIDKMYTINEGKFNLADRYAIGPISIVNITTNDAIRAKLAISFRPRPHHIHFPILLSLATILR